MRRVLLVLTVLAALLLAACGAEPQPVEVTRIVNQEVPVTVEVTRLVTESVTVEVPVEVTRVVEVVATPAAEAVAEAEGAEAAATAEPTVAAEPTATVEPTADVANAFGSTITVQAGDSLSGISERTGASIADIRAANNMNETATLIAGRTLIIPGWFEGETIVTEAPTPAATTEAAAEAPAEEAAPPAPTEAAPAPPPAPAANLLPNPSFEGDWYFYLYNELQVPEGWQLATDEGANTLEGGAGGVFNRPEVRVVPAKDLPPSEQSSFIFEGDKTVKAFKGGAPTSFSMFTDVPLQPGTYRMAINFFPDTVLAYEGGSKIFSPDPLAAEARVIAGSGGTGWQGTNSGQRNTITYDFTITEPQTVRVGGAFRNRYVMANNGWFLDGWSLTRVGE